jgi:putative chitinase
MALTSEQLAAIMPAANPADIQAYLDAINDTMDSYEINTPERQAAFLGQIAEESNELWHIRAHFKSAFGEEYASGKLYEGRVDLGNTQPGDGVRYKGRGLLQTTGRANYQKLSDALGVDFVSNPEWVAEPDYSCQAACYYWQSHGLNELADAGAFKTITKRINGGLNGYPVRVQFWERAKAALGTQS